MVGCGTNRHCHKDATMDSCKWYHCTYIPLICFLKRNHWPSVILHSTKIAKLSELKTQEKSKLTAFLSFMLVHLATEVSTRTQTLTLSSWKHQQHQPAARNHDKSWDVLQQFYQREIPIYGSLRLGKSTGKCPLPMPTVDPSHHWPVSWHHPAGGVGF